METKIGPVTGIIYCRVSSKDQVDGTSLESQEKICQEYANRLGIKILQVFVEKGESAKTTDRTQFTKAITLCSRKKPKVDYFIVHKLDRFARNQDDHVIVRQMLRKYGTELKSATEPISDTPVGRAMEGMISVFAEFDNNVRRERCMGGMHERIKQGIWCWPAPFGYYRATQGSNIQPDPQIAPYIRMTFEEYAKGIHTFDSLAKHLSSRGLKTRNNCAPFKQLVERILKNPIYSGYIEMWGERYKGSFEPIISETLFNQCQINKKHIPLLCQPRLQKHPLFPLRKLIVCSECNKPLTGSSCRGKMGTRYPYYHHHHQDCLQAQYIPKKDLEDKFILFLKSITPKPKFEKLFKEVAIDIWKENNKNASKLRNITLKDIATLEYEKQRTFEFHRKGIYTDDDFSVQKRIINTQIEQKLNLLEKATISPNDLEQALNLCFKYIRATPKIWKKADYPLKIEFQKLIFPGGKVNYDGKNFGTQKISSLFERFNDTSIHNPPTTDSDAESKFGTPDLSLIYAANQAFDGQKSQLVDLLRKHWNTWNNLLEEWNLFDRSFNEKQINI